MKINSKLLMTFGVLMALLSQKGSAHGIPMYIGASADGKLFAQSTVTYDAAQSILKATPIASPVAVVGNAALHFLGGNGVGAGTAWTFDVSGSAAHPLALAYWDNATSTLGDSPVPIGLARAASSLSLSIAPTDTFLTGVTFPAWNGVTLTGHTAMTITLPLSAPTGLYVIGFQVTSPGFSRSETFWGVANYGVPAEQVPAGLAAIAAAVPEPSSFALAGLAVVLGGVSLTRRKFSVMRQRRDKQTV